MKYALLYLKQQMQSVKKASRSVYTVILLLKNGQENRVLKTILHEGLLMTDCFHSMAPGDEELLKYALDDEPMIRRSQEHVEQCLICQRRLTRYKRLNALLLAKLYRCECPSAMTLSYYCANLLPLDDVITIAEHTRSCLLCAEEIVEIQRALAQFDPFSVVEQPVCPPKTSIRRIIAELLPLPPRLTLRSEASTSSHWPRRYRAGNIMISLHLLPGRKGETMLLGLFAHADPEESIEMLEGVRVNLYEASENKVNAASFVPGDEEPIMETSIDDLGNIVFKGVPDGRYAMIIRPSGSEIIISDLVVM